MKGLVTLQNIKSHKTYYNVYKFSDSYKKNHIQEMNTVSKPFSFLDEPESYWIQVKSVYGDYETKVSLQDAGVQPNTYNEHLTFDNIEDAETYMNS